MEEDKEIKEPKVSKTTKPKKEDIIILRLNSLGNDDAAIKVLEEKYTEKFGCKVVILENNLVYVNCIDR
jgi:hypothetical protein